MDCLACGPDLDQLLDADAALRSAWGALPRKRLNAGQMLVQPGDTVQAAWRVQSGLMRLYYLSAEGLERNRSFHAEGQWFGAGVPPHAQPSAFAIEALEPTDLVELPYSALETWASQGPIRERLADVLASSLRQRDEREASLLLRDATQRYQDFVAQEPALAARLPLHHIASHLGITNVALSRIRRRLKG